MGCWPKTIMVSFQRPCSQIYPQFCACLYTAQWKAGTECPICYNDCPRNFNIPCNPQRAFLQLPTPLSLPPGTSHEHCISRTTVTAPKNNTLVSTAFIASCKTGISYITLVLPQQMYITACYCVEHDIIDIIKVQYNTCNNNTIALIW
jgi:hypothetical protein